MNKIGSSNNKHNNGKRIDNTSIIYITCTNNSFKNFVTKSLKCTCQSCFHRHFMLSYVRFAIVFARHLFNNSQLKPFAVLLPLSSALPFVCIVWMCSFNLRFVLFCFVFVSMWLRRALYMCLTWLLDLFGMAFSSIRLVRSFLLLPLLTSLLIFFHPFHVRAVRLTLFSGGVSIFDFSYASNVHNYARNELAATIHFCCWFAVREERSQKVGKKYRTNQRNHC